MNEGHVSFRPAISHLRARSRPVNLLFEVVQFHGSNWSRGFSPPTTSRTMEPGMSKKLPTLEMPPKVCLPTLDSMPDSSSGLRVGAYRLGDL